jgi:hypothetical protein
VILGALIGRSLGRARGLLAGLIVLLCGFQLIIVLIAAEIQRTQTFNALASLLPPAFQSLVGGLVFTSFGGIASFGFVHPIVVLVLVEGAIFLASEPAWEIESGIIDSTMARPVPRPMLIARTVLLVFGATAVVLLLMVVSMRLALHALAPPGVTWPRPRTQLLLASNLMALAWWFAGLSLLASGFVRRRSVAIGAAGLSAVALYLFEIASGMSKSLQPYRRFNPFHYYDAPSLIRGSDQDWARHVALLAGSAALLCIAAWRAYERRDL